MAENAQVQPVDVVRFGYFLELTPPGKGVQIDVQDIKVTKYSNRTEIEVLIPDITIYCGNQNCLRSQFFTSTDDLVETGDRFLTFSCRNCGASEKVFAVKLWGKKKEEIYAYKFGEVPSFGPPMPAKLLQLAGDYQSLLKKGRRSENQSLGIGAFAYYRRAVEQQKSELINELRKAIDRLGGNAKAIAALDAAEAETQFTNALEKMASVTPKELFVSGQNPLKLLHGALSVGLHGRSDEECLKKAHSIRVVLQALLERIQMVTEEKAELDAAIKDLLPGQTE